MVFLVSTTRTVPQTVFKQFTSWRLKCFGQLYQPQPPAYLDIIANLGSLLSRERTYCLSEAINQFLNGMASLVANTGQTARALSYSRNCQYLRDISHDTRRWKSGCFWKVCSFSDTSHYCRTLVYVGVITNEPPTTDCR